MATFGILGLLTAACTSGVAHGHGANSESPTAAAERPQAAALDLAAGRSSAQYQITAPSPAHYDFDVTVSAPASADVTVNIRTWYGTTLGILDSSRDMASCRHLGSKDVCLEQLPLLEGQLAGKWTVIAAKQSGAAAKVYLSVTFARP